MCNTHLLKQRRHLANAVKPCRHLMYHVLTPSEHIFIQCVCNSTRFLYYHGYVVVIVLLLLLLHLYSNPEGDLQVKSRLFCPQTLPAMPYFKSVCAGDDNDSTIFSKRTPLPESIFQIKYFDHRNWLKLCPLRLPIPLSLVEWPLALLSFVLTTLSCNV